MGRQKKRVIHFIKGVLNMKTHKKIDIYLKSGQYKYFYFCSTNASKTCKEAKTNFLLSNPQYSPHVVKANFARV